MFIQAVRATVAMVASFPGVTVTAMAAEPVTAHELQLRPDVQGPVIHRDIFGQFAEMLGEGIYGGIWVGLESKIPNVRGIRTDVVKALRELQVPNVRWPGGCFADQYHWRDGIGSRRTARVNAIWGGVIEPNTFGTHEFMDLVEQIGSEAYLSINIGSGTVQEAADWLEYMTSDAQTALAQERAANGRAKPWKIKFLGLGNESWGCGGMFTADEYTQKMRQFGSMVKSLHPDQLGSFFASSPNAMRRIGVGEGLDATSFTEAVMKSWAMGQPFFSTVDGLSLHHYTGSMLFDDSVEFGEREYARILKSTYLMNTMIDQHAAIMDKADPEKRVPIAIDEWGAWLKPLPGTRPMFLRQQNSIRDAILAAINLNIFARHADRVRMANIAQMINVIQSMILTDGERMLLTPTYHVFRIYVPFQEATLVPTALDPGAYTVGDISLPQIDAIAARTKDGTVWVALANLDPHRGADVRLTGVSASGAVGHTLTADAVNAVNTFEAPDAVAPKPYSAKVRASSLTLRVPAMSVTVVQLQGLTLASPTAMGVVSTLSTRSSLGVLLANPAAKAILDRRLQGFSTGNVELVKDVPLRQLRILVPDKLTDEVLESLDEELAKVRWIGPQ